MEVVVLKKFIDRHTKQVHKKGATIEVTPERLAEINKVGKFVNPVEIKKPPKKAKVKEK